MADNNSSGFFGAVVGALVVGILVLGYFVYMGHGLGEQAALNVHVTTPTAPG